MSITVYSKPACPACKGTYRLLDKAGLAYDKVDISEDAEGHALVSALGYSSVPVVVADEDHWSGLRPSRIDALTRQQ